MTRLPSETSVPAPDSARPNSIDPTIAPQRPMETGGLNSSHPAMRSLDRIGEYKLLGILGTGGMGIVYKALDETLGGRIVALKMLQVGSRAGSDELIRFRGEAETLGKLQNPHIVQVFDFGMHEGAPYLVLEFVNGGSLDRKLQGQAMEAREAAQHAERLARAMHVAHEQGIIHRDLKPANIMLTAEGMPKITDFGLAKNMQLGSGLTQTGAVMGTPSYMAPEQAAGKKDVGRAADIYSLGAILYEMITGMPPFRGETLQETLEQVQFRDPTPPSRIVKKVPPDLQSVCLTCLHKAPGRRYPTAVALADELKNFLDGLPVKANPSNRLERMVRLVTRSPLRTALVASVLLVLLLTVILALFWYKKSIDDDYKTNLAMQEKAISEADAAKKEAEQSVSNIRETLNLTMAGDLNTTTGLERVENKLKDHNKQGWDEPVRKRALADAFSRLATLWKEQGEVLRAIESLNLAIQLAESVAAKEPGSPLAILLQRPRFYQERGFLRAENNSNPQDAVKDCEEAMKLLNQFKPEDQQDRNYKRLRAETLHNLGVARSNLRDGGDTLGQNLSQAKVDLLEAEDLLRELASQRDVGEASETRNFDENNLARTLGYLGDIYLKLGQCHEADAIYWDSHRIREKMYEGKRRDLKPRYQLARSWDNLGRSQTLQRSLATARFCFLKSEELRRELLQKQPENKEYILELAGVVNRIAELDLFSVDQDLLSRQKQTRDAILKTLDETKFRLTENARILVELFQDLKSDTTRRDLVTATTLFSRLGECHALEARLALIRNSLTPDKKEIETAWIAVRDAREDYRNVEARRKSSTSGEVDLLDTEPPPEESKLTNNELYQQAAVRFLWLEIYQLRHGKPIDNYDIQSKRVSEVLKVAIDRGFHRLSPEEMHRDRAFRAFLKDDSFTEQEKNYRRQFDKTIPRPAPPVLGKDAPAAKGA